MKRSLLLLICLFVLSTRLQAQVLDGIEQSGNSLIFPNTRLIMQVLLERKPETPGPWIKMYNFFLDPRLIKNELEPEDQAKGEGRDYICFDDKENLKFTITKDVGGFYELYALYVKGKEQFVLTTKFKSLERNVDLLKTSLDQDGWTLHINAKLDVEFNQFQNNELIRCTFVRTKIEAQ